MSYMYDEWHVPQSSVAAIPFSIPLQSRGSGVDELSFLHELSITITDNTTTCSKFFNFILLIFCL